MTFNIGSARSFMNEAEFYIWSARCHTQDAKWDYAIKALDDAITWIDAAIDAIKANQLT